MPQKSGLQNSGCLVGKEPRLNRVLRKGPRSENGWSVTSCLDIIITSINNSPGHGVWVAYLRFPDLESSDPEDNGQEGREGSANRYLKGLFKCICMNLLMCEGIAMK